ncbi:hypothetical protein [Palleronia sp.]
MYQKPSFLSRLRHFISTDVGYFSLEIALWVPLAGIAIVLALA